MRVQSKRWFRRNRKKYPILTKVLQHVNKQFPEHAHNIEIEFRTHDVTAWLSNTVVCQIGVFAKFKRYNLNGKVSNIKRFV